MATTHLIARAPHPDAEILTPAEAAFVVALSPTTLAKKRLDGSGPPFTKHSSRIVRYRRADLVQWLGVASRSTAEADRFCAPRRERSIKGA